MTAEISDESLSNERFSKTAQKVSQECVGLPLAIVTVGMSLKGKNEYDFRDMLRKLRDPYRRNSLKTHVVLYSCIKASYNYLESDKHRSLLLLCYVFLENYDIPLEDLVRYARRLFDTFKTMAEARDAVEAIVDDLMRCYLLLLGERRKCVKLHDVVRDVCLSIASEFGNVNISLKFDDLRNMAGLHSQKLRLLRLVNTKAFWISVFPSGNLSLEETENKEMNFPRMQELRVLEVNHITISLPLSQSFMVNLHTVCLDYCRLQGDFVGIGSKKLTVLSLFHSIVEMFPMKSADLPNLQCLDLRFHLNYPTAFPLGTISSLKELEELYLGDNVLKDIANFEEVHSLSKLHTILFVVKDDICFEVLLKKLEASRNY